MTPADSLTEQQIRHRIRELGEWFHNLDLRGVPTAPAHFLGDYPRVKWTRFAAAIPDDLHGASVLDIGCNAGFYSIEMKRRGAGRVVGIDSDPDYLAQARFASEVCNAPIELRCMSVYDIARLQERFDWVLFLGVFYHLRYPLLALDLIRKHVVRDRFVFQSMLRGSQEVDAVEENYPFSERSIFDSAGFPKMHFIEQNYSNDPTNWWIPNRACVEAMLRSADFEILARPEEEIYICRKRP
jgi:tRNA (mo5U34)-methyltransferase